MSTLVDGLTLSIDHALPVVAFAMMLRFGRSLDLSLDALLALAGVVYCQAMKDTGSILIAATAGVGCACVMAGIRFAVSEWARVPVEVCSLLLSFIIFRALALWVGEVASLPPGESRAYSSLYAVAPWLPTAVGVALLAVYVAFLQWVQRTHFGLMYRGLGDNPSLQVRLPRWQVIGAAVVGAAALTAFAGVVQADRIGQMSVTFRLDRLVDAFIVAELTGSIERRLRGWAQIAPERWRRPLVALADIPVALQVLVSFLVLGTVAHWLACRLDPNLPTIVYSGVVLLLMMQSPRLSWLWKSEGIDPDGAPQTGLHVNGISKKYRGYQRQVDVLEGVSLEVADSKSGLLVLLGDNASGKSTLMRILAGVEAPDRGMSTFDGNALASCARLITQDPGASLSGALTIRENLELAVGRAGRWHPLADREVRSLLAPLTAGSDEGRATALLPASDRPLSTLSGGQKQLLAIVAASNDGSAVILGDEPTKMLDATHRKLVESELIRLSRERLVIISSHDARLDLAPADCHFRLINGNLVQGLASNHD